jgi:GMP synthase-like glutamine amidotransferase
VVAVPPRYRITAARDGVPVDGLEHEELPIFSFQFHPEAREEFASRSGIDPALIDERVRSDSRRLLAAFRQRALRRAR